MHNKLMQYNDDWTSILSELVSTLITQHTLVNVYKAGHFVSSGRLIELDTNDVGVYRQLGTLNECCVNFQFTIESIHRIDSFLNCEGLQVNIDIEKE